MKNKLKNIFETKMFLLSIIPYLFLTRLYTEETYSINKTIGWAYDITGFSFFIVNIIIGFFIGFCLLAVLKAKTNWFLSFLFFLLLSFCTIAQDGIRNIKLIDTTLIITILIFILLFINAIFLRIKALK